MTISVVIPAYNEAHMIEACLASLARQTRQADEIIVVDNNSTDSTADIARRYNCAVIQETVQGIMPAVFAGMSACSGDIIARCDADSILPPDWLETIEATFVKCPDISGVTGPGVFYGTNRLAAAAAQIWYMYAYFILVGAALANWPLFGSNCAIRRSAWECVAEKLHKDRPDIHDDMEISLHLSPDSRIALLPGMKVQISARSLQVRGLRSRYAKGFKSLTIHYPAHLPWRLWKVRLSRQN